ncbi:enterobactin transporter EntS [Shewanella salipaludis]|uniref:Enterobactin transporter EntS n=1 Tax=Shewanella salipaludis TaxID=2723052 RepID=A0A972FQQ7_9GAMM|nr:enterobactin transporter EntS [Shewanella salipaludis]NMH64002.1 enterobactin transporter EntS [Shewanella salipaludis]
MKKHTIFVDVSLLKSNPYFRMVFIARLFSLLALGMLTVAVPLQVHSLTGSNFHVGIILALDGAGMLVGLLLGGVLADRYERRQLILTGRIACALGFSALAINCYFASPSLLALYLLSLWSGFFGAIGITALMAAIPLLVGRENLAKAGALSMLTVRIGTVVSPLIGGMIIAMADISWNYTAAAIGTFLTLIPLRRLPKMQAPKVAGESPLASFVGGLTFIYGNNLVCGVAAIGLLDAVSKGVRVLFPALAIGQFGGGAFELGLLFSAVPLGASLFAFTSGRMSELKRPGLTMILSSMLAFATLGLLSIASQLWAALLILGLYGYFGAISALLQYTLIQGHTPTPLLGRSNSLWTAQNVAGDSLGALVVGSLNKLLSPASCALLLGTVTTLGALTVCWRSKPLRRLRQTARENTQAGGEPGNSSAREAARPQLDPAAAEPDAKSM